MTDVPAKTHDRECFYKYRSAAGVVEILSKLHVSCSSPRLFNDPFDTVLELRFGFDPGMIAKLFWERIQQIASGKIAYECPDDNLLGWMINYFKANPDKGKPEIPFEDVAHAFDPGKDVEIARSILAEGNRSWLEFIDNERIFCMSEVYDDILMWSHYADQHRGAVVEFRCIPTLDSAFNVASRVNYSPTKPTFGTLDDWFDHMSGRKAIDVQELSRRYSFTKSWHWQYEKEWRFSLKKLPGSEQLFEYRDIDAKGL